MSDNSTRSIDYAAGLDAAQRYVRACFPGIPRELQEDAAQDGWLAYLRNAARLDPTGVQGYVNVCARNAALGMLAKRQPASLDALAVDALDELADHRADVHRQVEAGEALNALQKLRPLRRAAMLAQVIGATHAETADAFGWSLRQVERHVCEGRGELRELHGY